MEMKRFSEPEAKSKIQVSGGKRWKREARAARRLGVEGEGVKQNDPDARGDAAVRWRKKKTGEKKTPPRDMQKARENWLACPYDFAFCLYVRLHKFPPSTGA